jgi:hypothetical protein
VRRPDPDHGACCLDRGSPRSPTSRVRSPDPGRKHLHLQQEHAPARVLAAGQHHLPLTANSDLAFRGRLAFHGNYDGAMKAACAGGNGFTTWSLDPADGGSLENPAQLYSTVVPGVTIGHSAGFTWDGKVLIFGHEPGGGAAPNCQATSSTTDRSLFFYAAATGAPLGTILHPRPQTATENCTWHNYNIVPTDKRYVLVSGNYQSGILVVDFSDPANARAIAYADPAPLVPTQLGGDWSSYWYDGRIYESDITRGLLVWNLSDPATAGARKLGHLNPQTQESTIG